MSRDPAYMGENYVPAPNKDTQESALSHGASAVTRQKWPPKETSEGNRTILKADFAAADLRPSHLHQRTPHKA
jgi:hypothetical protein